MTCLAPSIDLVLAPAPVAPTAPAFNLATHNGEITVHNRVTGAHRTFRVATQPKDSTFAPGKRIVSLLVGPDNTSDYQAFGFVDRFGEVYCWNKFKGTGGKRSDFERFAAILSNPAGFAARGLEFSFSGRCRVCNRPLTRPDSIARGTGPTCGGR